MSGPADTEWHGNDAEAEELKRALNRNCQCKYDDFGSVSDMCVVHKALLKDQRFLDGLLFVKRMKRQFTEAERKSGKKWHSI